MARVHLSGEFRRLAGGLTVVEVDADTVAELVDALSDRFPDLGRRLDEGMAVALDGEVVPNADYEPVTTDSEVHFLPSIGGG